MNIRVQKIDTDLARAFSSFILPAVSADPDFEEFTFYAAITGDTLCGILVSDLKEFEPEILSIGVSKDYENNGIAKKLLSYALTDIFSLYDVEELDNVPNQVTARVVAQAGKLDKMDHILKNAGFQMVEKGQFCETSVKAVKGNRYLQNPTVLSKLNKDSNNLRFRSLKDIPHSLIYAFSNKLLAQDEFPGIEIDDLDEDLSVFGIQGREITMCILFLKENGGILQNNFLYKEDAKGMGNTVLLYMASYCANVAIKKFSEDVLLNFWITTDTTRKMIDQIFPDAVCTQEAAFYELPFYELLYRHDSKFTADIEFSEISNENLACKNCRHCMENMVSECAKYAQKPGPVLEGRECEMFEAL